MKFLIFIFSFIYLVGANLEVVKYVSHKNPKILIEYNNLPIKIKKLLKVDSNIIAHYDFDFVHIEKSIKSIFVNKDIYKKYAYLLRLDFKDNKLTSILYDLTTKKSMMYKVYKIDNMNIYPFMVHALNYDINTKLGFTPIDWINRKIVYSIFLGPKSQSIFISDITLTYRKKIISGGLNVFPKWANKEQTEIFYTKIEKTPVLYKYNIFTGNKERVLASKGMLVVSDVKGNKLLLTLAPNDQPDIYEFDITKHSLKRLTKFKGIDVNGKFYDTGILFISDRLGYPNVYQKNLTTENISKVIYHGKNHIAVTVNKDNIVVSSRETNNAFDNNTFNLLLVNKKTNYVKRLTFGGKNMLPVFSPDGSTLLFLKEYKFHSKFGIIRLDENKVIYFKINRRIQSFDF